MKYTPENLPSLEFNPDRLRVVKIILRDVMKQNGKLEEVDALSDEELVEYAHELSTNEEKWKDLNVKISHGGYLNSTKDAQRLLKEHLTNLSNPLSTSAWWEA